MCWCVAAAAIEGQRWATADDGDWQTSRPEQIKIEKSGPTSWKVKSDRAGEFTLESQQSLSCQPESTFAVNLSIRVDLDTKALPELACFDATGNEIPGPSALEYGPRYFTTNWQELRRVFLVQPGSATVRARMRASGKGQIELADLQFQSQPIDPYQTGSLVTQLHASLRHGSRYPARIRSCRWRLESTRGASAKARS